MTTEILQQLSQSFTLPQQCQLPSFEVEYQGKHLQLVACYHSLPKEYLQRLPKEWLKQINSCNKLFFEAMPHGHTPAPIAAISAKKQARMELSTLASDLAFKAQESLSQAFQRLRSLNFFDLKKVKKQWKKQQLELNFCFEQQIRLFNPKAESIGLLDAYKHEKEFQQIRADVYKKPCPQHALTAMPTLDALSQCKLDNLKDYCQNSDMTHHPLFEKQNKVFADKLIYQLKHLKPQDKAIAFIGVGHFFGDKGLIKHLENQGATLLAPSNLHYQPSNGEVNYGRY